MDDEEIRQHVVRRLASGSDRNDVILEVCQRQGLDWGQAEALVAEIADTATGEVARRRFPLFAVLAAGIILAGIALIANFLIVALLPLMDSSLRSRSSGVAEAGGVIGWLLLNMEFVAQLGVGAAMVVGGAMGLYRVMRDTLEM